MSVGQTAKEILCGQVADICFFELRPDLYGSYRGENWRAKLADPAYNEIYDRIYGFCMKSSFDFKQTEFEAPLVNRETGERVFRRSYQFRPKRDKFPELCRRLNRACREMTLSVIARSKATKQSSVTN